MPEVGAYSLYVTPYTGPERFYGGWVVRVYRDSDDQHIHSAEGGVTLQIGLREAEQAIEKDRRELVGRIA